MKMGNRGPHFGGPYFHMTPVHMASLPVDLWYCFLLLRHNLYSILTSSAISYSIQLGDIHEQESERTMAEEGIS